ncbi:hypothetical protein Forpe1208_v014490 [Fusarium oxysporum f. sp. rapae]|uniref:Uncharacterized protein n=1 Tax=Fusarium oxysporum f. sp. rapae TaxID=485398 RepID=A0A8J5TZV5_FUSOX|nr:hypothetical protein Forpe1208_v014490 [Fusarium oxysporum f. sp. rapae]
MARTCSTPKKTTGGKGASALLKASGKGKSARATKSVCAAAPATSPVKSPKKKLMYSKIYAMLTGRSARSRVLLLVPRKTILKLPKKTYPLS